MRGRATTRNGEAEEESQVNGTLVARRETARRKHRKLGPVGTRGEQGVEKQLHGGVHTKVRRKWLTCACKTLAQGEGHARQTSVCVGTGGAHVSGRRADGARGGVELGGLAW
ncbi:hypothetical protein TIFTF001_032797 [Ficus carica]|uniref:Uncharacterized protein n=1 Tax=Ficus carica TaxID=3494 RepID=A0AA88DXV9_FICCA|nr:hypothetical protein TIFTF001_032797 [Ficus carica]